MVNGTPADTWLGALMASWVAMPETATGPKLVLRLGVAGSRAVSCMAPTLAKVAVRVVLAASAAVKAWLGERPAPGSLLLNCRVPR